MEMFTVEETQAIVTKTRNWVLTILTVVAGICGGTVMVAWTVNFINNLP